MQHWKRSNNKKSKNLKENISVETFSFELGLTIAIDRKHKSLVRAPTKIKLKRREEKSGCLKNNFVGENLKYYKVKRLNF